MVRADLGHRALLGDIADQVCRVREFLVAELDDDALRAGVQLFDIGDAAEDGLAEGEDEEPPAVAVAPLPPLADVSAKTCGA